MKQALQRLRFLLPSAFLTVFAFLLIPPWYMARSNLVVPMAQDECDYLAHVTALVYGRTDYRLETSQYMPFNHAVGAPLLAAPIVFAFSLADHWRHNPVVIQRTEETIQHSWTGLGFPVATQLYMVIATFLLYRLLTCLDAPFPSATTILSVAASGILFYAYRRPVSSHVYECAAIALALLFLTAKLAEADRPPRWGLITAIAILIFLVRYNDLPFSLALIWCAVTRRFSPGRPLGWLRLRPARRAVFLSMFALLSVVGLMAWVSYHACQPGQYLWNADIVKSRLSPKSPLFYVERLWYVFFGRGWAMVVTAPLVLVGLGTLLLSRDLRTEWLPFLLAAACNLGLVLSWGTQASGYGYRYFVPSALPLATVGLGHWMSRGQRPRRRLALIAALAVLPTLLLLVFGTSSSVTLAAGRTRWEAGWVNDNFLPNAFSALFLHPATTWAQISDFSGFAIIRQWLGHAPAGAESFDLRTTVKMAGTWVLPLVTGCALALLFDKRSACPEN